MPIFEYKCSECEKEFAKLILKKDESISCPFCGNTKLTRLFSRFSTFKTEADRLSELDTKKIPDESYYKHAGNIGLWAKKRAKELGIDLGEQFEEKIEKARSSKIDDLF